MAKEKLTIQDIAGETFELSNIECREIIAKFDKSFGGYSPKGINTFYDKANIAKIEWDIPQNDKKESPIPAPSGRLVAIYVVEGIKGTKAWRDYKFTSDRPFEFWEYCFRQVDKYLARVEYAKEKELQELATIVEQHDNIGETLPLLPTGDTTEAGDREELPDTGGIPVSDQEQ